MKTKEEIEKLSIDYVLSLSVQENIGRKTVQRAFVYAYSEAQAYHEDKTRWIDVIEKRPNLGDYILCVNKDNEIIVAKYTTYEKGCIGYENGWKDCWFESIQLNRAIRNRDVTHWQPIPTPPKINAE